MLNLSMPKLTLLRHLPHQPGQILGLVLSILGVLVAGVLIAAALPEEASAWMTAAAYLAPASVAFVVRWWMDQEV